MPFPKKTLPVKPRGRIFEKFRLNCCQPQE